MKPALTSLLVLAACTPKSPSSPPALAEAAPAPARRPLGPGLAKLTLSITPHLDPEYLKKSYAPFIAYLQEHLGVPVGMVVAKSYDDLGGQLLRHEVDLAVFSPFAYVRARQTDPGLQPVVGFISDGSASSAGYIVVKADSPFRTLEDLKGHSMAFVDPASASGYLYPTKMMLDRGIDPKKFFSKIDFLGNHESALLAVYQGRYDAGATYQGALPALERQKGISPLSFRIVAKTARTPRDLVCARADLPPAVVEQVRQVMLALTARTPEGRELLTPMNANGFVPADDHLYDPVREAYAAVVDAGPH